MIGSFKAFPKTCLKEITEPKALKKRKRWGVKMRGYLKY